MNACALIWTHDPALRREALRWPRPGAVELLFHEDAAAAVSAARELPLRLFVLDLRGGAAGAEGLLRRVRALPSSPELLLLQDRETPPYDSLPPEAVYVGSPQDTALGAAFARLLALAEVRATSGLIGNSPGLRGLLHTIAQVAPLDVPVLIQGESGTGKEVVARALHRGSSRARGPFESLNVGSVAESLLESELFGHEKGAFTGAIARREGVFERANGGTLFLDELGEMPLAMQVRLLRVLETSEYLRVGGSQLQRTNVRLLGATHRSLEAEMAAGRFRSDLYYRLKVVKIELPPLRERAEDIPALVQHFLEEARRRHGVAPKGLTREAMERLLLYAWPGNVRELRNVVASMAVLGRGEYLGLADLPPELRGHGAPPLPVALPGGATSGSEAVLTGLMGLMAEMQRLHARLDRIEGRLGIDLGGATLRPVADLASEAEFVPLGAEGGGLAAAERALIESTLRQEGGNRRRTAKQLGISERTLYRKLREYGL
jgi:DNA-binding NtrC family response regulator